MAMNDATHWYQHNTSERRDLIASWEGVYVTDEGIQHVTEEFQALTGCKLARALGQTIDDLGRYQYLFAIHPDEEYTFSDARFDTRYRGEFAWAREICFFNDW